MFTHRLSSTIDGRHVTSLSSSIGYLALSPRLQRSTNYHAGVRRAASMNEIHQLYSALQDLIAPSPPSVTRRIRAHTAPIPLDIAAVDNVRYGKSNSREAFGAVVQRSKSDVTAKVYRVGQVCDTKNQVCKTRSCNTGGKKHKLVSFRLGKQKEPFVEKCKEQRKVSGSATVKSNAMQNNVLDIDTLIEIAKLNSGPTQNKRKSKTKATFRGQSPSKRPSVVMNADFVNPNFSSEVVSSRLDYWYQKASETTLAFEKANNEPESLTTGYVRYRYSESDSEAGEHIANATTIADGENDPWK